MMESGPGDVALATYARWIRQEVTSIGRLFGIRIRWNRRLRTRVSVEDQRLINTVFEIRHTWRPPWHLLLADAETQPLPGPADLPAPVRLGKFVRPIRAPEGGPTRSVQNSRQ